MLFALTKMYAIDYEKENIKVLLTAALIDQAAEMRKNEYIHSINIFRNLGINPYIVESIKVGPTFLNNFVSRIIYPQVNIPAHNKGVNELRSLIAALNQFDFKDDDMIVKLTGRYYFKDDTFLKTILAHPNIDGFVKLDNNPHTPKSKSIHTGCFALRCKYLKQILPTIDQVTMETNMINFEELVGNAIYQLYQEGKINVMYLDTLGIVANVFGNGGCQLMHW